MNELGIGRGGEGLGGVKDINFLLKCKENMSIYNLHIISSML